MSQSLKNIAALGRRCYSSVPLKKTFVPKANASSYTRKPATATSTRYRKTTTSSSSTPSAGSSDSSPSSNDFSEPGSFSTSSSYSSPLNSSNSNPFENPKTLNQIFPSTLGDSPDYALKDESEVNWSTSFSGLGSAPFPSHSQEVLAQSIDPKDIEIKPDGLIYLPEIKYRRILSKAFGAGGWGLVPRSETIVTDALVTREYGLVCLGRLVGIARGEQDYFSPGNIPTATEGCKSNALMRCCKDLGIASELWDPYFIKDFKAKYCEDKFVEHATTKKIRKIWKRKDRTIDYPYKVSTGGFK